MASLMMHKVGPGGGMKAAPSACLLLAVVMTTTKIQFVNYIFKSAGIFSVIGLKLTL